MIPSRPLPAHAVLAPAIPEPPSPPTLRSPRASCSWSTPWPLLLLLAALSWHAPSVAGEPSLTPDMRGHLAEAAQNTKLAPWQRQFMLEVARGNADARTAGPLPAFHGASRAPVGVGSGDGVWLGFDQPSARRLHTGIYDPVRGRMLVFGGIKDSDSHNDLWALSLVGKPSWSRLPTAGTGPSARYGHTAIYDPVRDRMLVFGGAGGPYLNDVWSLSLAGSPTWNALSPTGPPPPVRAHHTAVYDSARDRMLVFGGASGLTERNDVWELSLSGSPAWSALTPGGPPPSARHGHGAIYDPVRDRMLVFGGAGGSLLNDVWELRLSGSPVWSALAPSGTPPSAGSGRAIYDPAGDRMIVFGGITGSLINGVWELSLSGPAWSALAPIGTPPSARFDNSAIYDPLHGRMLVFGGNDGSYVNDLWGLALTGQSAWNLVIPAATMPRGHDSHTATYDPVYDRMLVFGGTDQSVNFNDVWQLSLAGNPGWSLFGPLGTPPSPRLGHSAIYDPVRDRLLVFGGWGSGTYHNDVWALSLSGTPAWSALAPTGTPPVERYFHTAIYDPVRDRMLVFGGWDGYYRNDVWALSLGASPAWSQLAPTGTLPPVRYVHAAIYDPLRDRMLVFAGVGGNPVSSHLNDVWALSLAGTPAWSALAPGGTPPSPRAWPSAIYDPVRDRMVTFGGVDGSVLYSDAWALPLTGSSVWRQLATTGAQPRARSEHTAIYDPVRDRMVVFGGYDVPALTDIWMLEWATPVSVPGDVPAGRFALAAPRPNPSFGRVTLDFSLPEATHVSLIVCDAAGRMVRDVVEGALPAGPHSVTWDSKDRNGRRVPAGVYLVRLDAPGARLVRKAVIAHAGFRE